MCSEGHYYEKKWSLTKQAGGRMDPRDGSDAWSAPQSASNCPGWLISHPWPPAFAVCVEWAQDEMTKSPVPASTRLQELLLTGQVTWTKQMTQKEKGWWYHSSSTITCSSLPPQLCCCWLCSTLLFFFYVAVFCYFLLIHSLTRKIECISCCKHFSITIIWGKLCYFKVLRWLISVALLSFFARV